MLDTTRRRRLIHMLKLVAISLLPATALLVVAEIVATLSISRRARSIVEAATGRTVYTMRIGRWPWSRVTITPLNSMGFPDAEFPQPESKGACIHVVFAGDSFVFGDGVDRDSSFVELVKRRALARDDRCVRIFNIGRRGTSIDFQARFILETVERLRPDVVVLGQYQNDLTDLTNPGAILDPNRHLGAQGDSIRVRLPVLNANFMKMLTYHTFAFLITRNIERDVLRHWSVLADSTRRGEAERLQRTYSELFAGLVDSLRSRNVHFGTIIFPSKFDILAKRSPEEAFFLRLAERHAVPRLRLFPLLEQRRDPYAFLMYDGHLNEHGNRLVADTVYAWLFETQPPPFAVLRQP